jgi:hypothetical protein
MGIFANVNEDNFVDNIIAIPDEFDHDGRGYIAGTLGVSGNWMPADGAWIGSEYIESAGKFMPRKPDLNPSFIFDSENWKWVTPVAPPSDAYWLVGFMEPPIPYTVEELEGEMSVKIIDPVVPADKKVYVWDEENTAWVRTYQFEPREIPVFNIDELKAKQKELAPPSFVENEDGFPVPPIPYPQDGKFYLWDEPTISWIEAERPVPPVE